MRLSGRNGTMGLYLGTGESDAVEMMTGSKPNKLQGKTWKAPWAGPVLGLALSLALCAPVMAGEALFAGVTGIEAAREATAAVQVLRFEADLPFQYQTEVLGPHQVLLRLYNARISSRLTDAQGNIAISAGGAVESAVLKPGGNTSYQEIILNGKGLGGKKLLIEGGSELQGALGIPAPERKTRRAEKPVVVFPALPAPMSGPGETPKTAQVGTPNLPAMPQGPLTMAAVEDERGEIIPEPAPEARIDILSKPGSLQGLDTPMPAATEAPVHPRPAGGKMIEMSAIPSTVTKGPSIQSVTNARRLPATQPASVSMPSGWMMGPATPGMQPAVQTASVQPPIEPPAPDLFGPALEEATLSLPDHGVEEAPAEPQLLIPLPRYQGGAAPIKAVTLDNNGRAVALRPKNDRSVMEVEWGEPNGGFNTLFQADGPARSAGQHMRQALALYKSGKMSEALREIEQGLEIDDRNADLYAALAEIHLHMAHKVEAEKAYERAARLNVKYGKRFAEVLVLSGKRTDAITYLKSIFRENPGQGDIAFMLGTLHEERGDTHTALAYLQQAARLQPESADIQYNLGLAYELSGDLKQAQTHYQKALALNPRANDIQLALERVKR